MGRYVFDLPMDMSPYFYNRICGKNKSVLASLCESDWAQDIEAVNLMKINYQKYNVVPTFSLFKVIFETRVKLLPCAGG